mgnify:FL=1
MKKYRFIDLFAGIGGFHMAFHKLRNKYPNECVFVSEIDKDARKTYDYNFSKKDPSFTKLKNKGNFIGDIQSVTTDDINQIPDHDILCAGFPCQPFSQAGYKRGFQEAHENRGNMFYEIVSIIQAKKPKAFFLENVRHLLNHDDKKTFLIIRQTLQQLGYSFRYEIVKASDFGLPQHRPRIFMVGFRDETTSNSKFRFPKPVPLKKTMSDILKGKCDREIGFTLRVGGARSGIDDRRNWDSYRVDGEVRLINVEEGREMMGYPKSFKFPVGKQAAMKQLGNSVAVNAVQATLANILFYLKTGEEPKGKIYDPKKLDFFE